MMTATRKNRGLSLAEVLVAVFVVGVGVLATASTLFYSVGAAGDAERRSQAVFWGREMLDLVRARNLPFQPDVPAYPNPINDGDYDSDADDNGARRPFNDPPFALDFPDTNFERRIEMKRLSNDPNHHLYQVAAIKITLFWNEGANEKRVTLWSYHQRP